MMGMYSRLTARYAAPASPNMISKGSDSRALSRISASDLPVDCLPAACQKTPSYHSFKLPVKRAEAGHMSGINITGSNHMVRTFNLPIEGNLLLSIN